MLPYWLLFAVFAAGSLSNTVRTRPAAGGSIMLGAAAIFTMLMIGLRHETGGDWFNYLEIFNFTRYQNLGEILSSGDPGYLLLNWIAQRLGVGVHFVNLVCGIIFTWGLVRFARHQPNPWLTIAIAVPYLIIVVAMGYTRQGVAIGLLMAGIVSIIKGERIKFLILIVIAAAFHKSAVIILPLVALAVVRNRLLTYGAIALLGVMLFFTFLDSYMDRLFTSYVEEGMASEGTAIRVAMNLVPGVLFLLLGKRFQVTEFERKLWRNFSLAAVGSMAAVVLFEASTVIDRLALYIIPLQLFVLSRLPYAFLERGRTNLPLVLGVIAYSALIQFVWLTQATHAHAWLPYMLVPME